jgi:ParB family chromosome partitioning protein
MGAKTVLAGVCDYKRGGEFFIINPDVIEIVEGWNARKDFSGEDELVAYIKANGVPEPLRVRKTKDSRLELISGERRLRAAKRAIAEGAELQGVPVIVAKRGANDADLFINDMCSNAGKPLTPTEEAGAFKRLVNWGFDVKEIHTKTGKSISHIRNRLELAEASPEVQAAVDAGQINIGQAQEIAKASDGNIDEQSQALKKAKAKPKKQKLVLTFKKGRLNHTGYKEKSCEPLKDVFRNPDIIQAISEAGFDPDSIRVTINPVVGAEQQEQIGVFDNE